MKLLNCYATQGFTQLLCRDEYSKFVTCYNSRVLFFFLIINILELASTNCARSVSAQAVYSISFGFFHSLDLDKFF